MARLPKELEVNVIVEANFAKDLLEETKFLREEISKLTAERTGLHILVEMLRKEVSEWELAEKAWAREETNLTKEINELMEENMKLRE